MVAARLPALADADGAQLSVVCGFLEAAFRRAPEEGVGAAGGRTLSSFLLVALAISTDASRAPVVPTLAAQEMPPSPPHQKRALL